MERSKQQIAKNKYLAEKVDSINFRVPKGFKAKIQEHAKSKNKSTNSYIMELIEKDMGIKMK